MTVWMLWSILFAMIVGVVALAVERAAAGFGAPRRHIWIVAIVVVAIIPVALAARRTERTVVRAAIPSSAPQAIASADAATAADPNVDEVEGPTQNALMRHSAVQRAALNVAAIDRGALALWISASGILTIMFAGSILRLRFRRDTWIGTTVADQSVLLSAEEGPAVVGFARPRIVLPRWALTLDRRAQEMILRHEAEHIRAGDPRTLLLAGVVLVALPWNAGVWWIVRRLRLAMEVDCDARVIRSVGAHEYGVMLLSVGEHRASMLPLASTLALTRPFLEQRIHAMTTPRPRRPLWAALPFVAIAAIATTAATRAPRPAPLRAPLITVQQVPAPPAPAKLVQSAPAARAVLPPQAPRPRRVATPAAAMTASLVAPVPVVSTPALIEPAQPIAKRAMNPDRAAIAEMVKLHAAPVVRGDTAANYVIMVVDATDKFVWSTFGSGGVSINVAGDPRTPRERAQFTRDHASEYSFQRAVALGGGRGRGGIAPPKGFFDSLPVRRVAADSLLVLPERKVRDSTVAALPRMVMRRRSDSIVDIAFKVKERRDTVRQAVASQAQGGGRGGAGGGRGAGGRGTFIVDSLPLRQYFSASAGNDSSADVAGVPYYIGWSGRGMSGAINLAAGLQELRPEESGIQGLAAKSVTSAEIFRFAPGELSASTLQVMVVHLITGASWKGR